MTIFQDAGVWVLFSFLIFCIIMWRFGKDKILGMIDKRIESVRKEIETAELLRVEAQELLAKYQRKQRDAAKEAEQIVAIAKAHAAEIMKQAERDLKEVVERREQQLAERLARMEQNAKREIQAYAAELAVKATSEIIAKQMDKKTNENLVDQSIRDVARKLS